MADMGKEAELKATKSSGGQKSNEKRRFKWGFSSM